MNTVNSDRRRAWFLVAAFLQIGCGGIFLTDVFVEWHEMTTHTWIEAMGVLALAVGAGINLREYASLVRRNKKIETALGVASGDFQDSVEQHFDTWDLTPAERDVALLTIKGATIADIAIMRETQVGTIKAQNASIYRKAAVSSRSELISTVIEDLIVGDIPRLRVAG